MKKRLLSLLCVLAGTISGSAQPKINDQFPVGHYQFAVDNFKISLDFFENKRSSLSFKSGADEEDPFSGNFILTGNYLLEQDAIRITSDQKNQRIQLFYRNNPNIQKGKIQIGTDYTNPNNTNYYTYSHSIAVGKNIKNEDFRVWEDIIAEKKLQEENYSDETTTAQFDYQPGDTLLFRISNSHSTDQNNYQYILPKNANDLILRFSQRQEFFELDSIRIMKGETDNEIKVSFDNKDILSLYYTRPVNNDDYKKNTDSLPFIPDYSYLQVNKTYFTNESESENKSEITYSDSDYQPGNDTIEYFTSYEKALKAAQKTNKFIRLYIGGAEPCEIEDPLKAIKNVNSDDYYTYYEIRQFMGQIAPNFITCILPAADKQLTRQFTLDEKSTRLILTKDGKLLLKETGCPESEGMSLKFSLENDYYSASSFYSRLMTKYIQEVLVPQINKTKNPDRKLLKEYLDGIFQMAKKDSYMYQWSSICQEITDVKNYSEIKTDQLPDTCIQSEEIGKYLNQYVTGYMNAPFDSTVATMSLLYYQYIFEYSTYPQSMPASLSYLIKHSEKLNELSNFSNQLEYVDFSGMLKRVLGPYNYAYNYYDDSGRIPASDVLKIVQSAYKLLPETSLRDECISDFYSYINYTPSAMAEPEVLNFFEGYTSENEKKFEENGYVGENDFSDILNSMAWSVYKSKNKTYTEKALTWSKKSIELYTKKYEIQNYYYLDTYAHLLYATGDYENALKYQKMAFDEVSKSEESESLIYREIKVEYELMKLKMLDNN